MGHPELTSGNHLGGGVNPQCNPSEAFPGETRSTQDMARETGTGHSPQKWGRGNVGGRSSEARWNFAEAEADRNGGEGELTQCAHSKSEDQR